MGHIQWSCKPDSHLIYVCFCASIVVIHWRIYSFRVTCDFPLFWNRCRCRRRQAGTIFQNATFQHTKLLSSMTCGPMPSEKKNTNIHSYSLKFIGSSDVYVEVSSPFIPVCFNECDVYGVGIRTSLHLKIYHSLCNFLPMRLRARL